MAEIEYVQKASASDSTPTLLAAVALSPIPKVMYILGIVELLFIVQVFCLQKVIVYGARLNGINEIQNRKAGTDFGVLSREKGRIINTS